MSSSKPTPANPSSHQRREELAADIQAFLDSGRKIEKVPTGVSGQDSLGRSKQTITSRNRKR